MRLDAQFQPGLFNFDKEALEGLINPKAEEKVE